MTIVNMVGGGGSSQADWDISVSANDPKIEVTGGYGSGTVTNSKTYKPSRSNPVFAYDGKCFKMTGNLYLSSSSTTYSINSHLKYDATKITLPDITEWVSKYNIKNAVGTVEGYWSTYGESSINDYAERVLSPNNDLKTYNVVVNDGIVDITNSTGTLLIVLGRKDTSSSRSYGNFYPTKIDIKVV